MVFAWGLFPEAPLVVAANRDEALDRPAEPPAMRVQAGVRVLAPLDVQAQGTWLGLNEHQVFVAITNRFGGHPDPSRTSRGQLVLSALEAPSAQEAFERISEIDARAYNGFHLIMADRAGAFIVWGDGEATHRRVLAPGWHVITERSFDAAPTKREDLVRELIDAWPAEGPSDSDLQTMLQQRSADGFEGVRVLVPAMNYGTRSSTIVRLRAEQPPVFLHAHGPPDEAPFEPYSTAL